MSKGIEISANDATFCKACALGKAKKQHSKQPPTTRATERLGRVHADLAGGGNNISSRGTRYVLILTDDCTRYKWIFPLRTKDEAAAQFREWLILMRNLYGVTVKLFRSDFGGEFIGMKPIFAEFGIQWETSAPEAKDQNGVSESAVRVIFTRARTMIAGCPSKVPKALYMEALACATYIGNLVPTTAVTNITPFEAFHNKIPELGHLRVWGCDAYYVDYSPSDKLAPRALKGIFVGYEAKNQYRIWNGRSVIIRRDVTFDETGVDYTPLTTMQQEEMNVLLGLPLQWEIESDVATTAHSPAHPILHTADNSQTTADTPSSSSINETGADGDLISGDDNGTSTVFNNENTGAEGDSLPSHEHSSPNPSHDEDLLPDDRNGEGAQGGLQQGHQNSRMMLRQQPRPSEKVRMNQNNQRLSRIEAGSSIRSPDQANESSDIVGETTDLPAVGAEDSSRSDSDIEEIGDTIVVDTPHLTQPVGEADVVQTSSGSTRRSTRTTKAPDWYGKSAKTFALAAQRAAADHPKTYKQACASPHHDDWLAAMNAEIASILANETWELVDLPPNRNTLRGRWVLTKKLAADGAILKYKARWVACGYAQQYGIDYGEVYASVVRADTIKVVLAVAAEFGWELQQMDVITAFLYGPIDEEIYVEQPHGYERIPGKVCRLKKSLYGLKQAPRIWYETIKASLIGFGFVPCEYDQALFIHQTKRTLVLVYTDDFILTGPDSEHARQVKALLSEIYSMKDLGSPTYYLGMEIECGPGYISLCQKGHIIGILKDYQMESCNPVSTPMNPGIQLSKAPEGYQATEDEILVYRSLTGSLLYVAVKTRPDIADAVSKLCRYSSNPTSMHWVAAKHVLRYLSGSADLRIVFKKGAFKLVGWTDASYADNLEDGTSTCGQAFFLASGIVSWTTGKQKSVALSTCEAEYMGQTLAATQAVWLKGLLSDILPNHPVHLTPTPIYADNRGAIDLAKNPEFHKRTRHIAVRWHYTRQCLREGIIDLVYKPTAEMLADGLTKALTKEKFSRFVKLLALQ